MSDAPVRSPLTGKLAQLADRFDAAAIIERWRAEGFHVGDQFGGRTTLDLYRCVETGYRFFHPPSLAGGSDFYDFMARLEASGSAPDYRRNSREFDWARARLSADDRVLDVGCGFGHFLASLNEVAEAVGIEGNAHAASVARSHGLDVRQGELAALAPALRSRFDVACAFQVLEHFFEAGQFLRDCYVVLKPGGRLIVAVPDSDPYAQRFNKYATFNTPPHHIGLWNRASLEAAGRLFGLEPVDHAYLECAIKPLSAAHWRAAYWTGVHTPRERHSLAAWLKILAAAPFALPLAAWDIATSGRSEATTILVEFRKG